MRALLPRSGSLLVAVLLVAACGSRDPHAGPDAAPDAGPDAAPDAGPDAAPDAGPDAGTPGPTRVLFIGNSYTYVNDLPGRVVAVAESLGLDPGVEVGMIASGGAWLADHAASDTTLAEIATGGWDVVVLQEQSYLPIVDPATFEAAAQDLADAARAAGATPALLETWARAEGNELYAGDLAGYTPATMQAALRDAYAAAAALAGAQVLPAGDRWEATLAAHPELPLHGADGSHPSPHGTYLTACVVLVGLTGASLDGADGAPAEVPPADAAILRSLAPTP